jgi:CheY-like chemotaxis protein
MLVLLVEDHDDTRDVNALYMRTQGIRVETAVTGLQAISMASQIRPDVIVMDLGLPGLDGWEATRRLKADAGTRSIPIVAISAHAMPSDEVRAREVGCDLFLRKPCTPDALLTAIRSFKPSPPRKQRITPWEPTGGSGTSRLFRLLEVSIPHP